jgi:t-SNARE complex subunit (syntaxin)
MDLEHERRLAACEERAKSNSHRIDKLEESTDVLNQLAKNMGIMAEKQKQMVDSVEKLDGKVTALEQ